MNARAHGPGLKGGALLALVLAACLGARATAQGQALDLHLRVDAILTALVRPADVLGARDELARLGPGGLEALFERLSADETPALGPFRSTAIQAALAQLPRADLLALLAGVAHGASEERAQLCGLDLLARLGTREELHLALELAAPSERMLAPSPALRNALERTLLSIVKREELEANVLADPFRSGSPAAQDAIATVLARLGGPETVKVLAALLGSAGAEADVLLLVQLGRSAARGGSSDEALLARVRAYLTNADPRLAVLACSACKRLRDHDAVPNLIALLAEHDTNLRARAYAALTSLTTVALPCELGPWIEWRDAALAWWDTRGDACRAALASGAALDAAAALGEVAGQRLFLPHVVELLELALHRPETDIVQSAARALAGISDPCAHAALTRILRSDASEPALVAAVRDALAHSSARGVHARLSASPPILPFLHKSQLP